MTEPDPLVQSSFYGAKDHTRGEREAMTPHTEFRPAGSGSPTNHHVFEGVADFLLLLPKAEMGFTQHD